MALSVELVPRIEAVDAAAWDALAGEDDPFVEHAFLWALEESGSVGPGTGWLPVHLLARDERGPCAALPLYVKHHSYGEYIFDFAWANGAARAGLDYYPKLVAMVPFTPATGQRILRRADVSLAQAASVLTEGLREVSERTNASSSHVLFITDEERAALREQGLLERRSLQFHWSNTGYESFEHYLEHFRSALRKQVRKERKQAGSHNLSIRTLEGAELTAADYSALASFYLDTCHKRGSGPYLTPRFFELLRERCAERVVAVIAYRGSTPIAGTLNFQKGKHLYGRYWGAREELPSLHFECCYYQLIERAIAQGLARFEAGAQGEHKLRRGLLPTVIHSVHAIAHAPLRAAIAEFLQREAAMVMHEIAMLGEHGPFRRGPASIEDP
jgi:predicted N-acyltransferase